MIFKMLMSGLYTQHFENVLCFQWLNMCKHQQLTLKINFLKPPIRSFHFLFSWCITFWPWYLINAAFVRADYKSLLLGSVTKFESLISRWKLSLATWRIRGKKLPFFFLHLFYTVSPFFSTELPTLGSFLHRVWSFFRCKK